MGGYRPRSKMLTTLIFVLKFISMEASLFDAFRYIDMDLGMSRVDDGWTFPSQQRYKKCKDEKECPLGEGCFATYDLGKSGPLDRIKICAVLPDSCSRDADCIPRDPDHGFRRMDMNNGKWACHFRTGDPNVFAQDLIVDHYPLGICGEKFHHRYDFISDAPQDPGDLDQPYYCGTDVDCMEGRICVYDGGFPNCVDPRIIHTSKINKSPLDHLKNHEELPHWFHGFGDLTQRDRIFKARRRDRHVRKSITHDNRKHVRKADRDMKKYPFDINVELSPCFVSEQCGLRQRCLNDRNTKCGRCFHLPLTCVKDVDCSRGQFREPSEGHRFVCHKRMANGFFKDEIGFCSERPDSTSKSGSDSMFLPVLDPAEWDGVRLGHCHTHKDCPPNWACRLFMTNVENVHYNGLKLCTQREPFLWAFEQDSGHMRKCDEANGKAQCVDEVRQCAHFDSPACRHPMAYQGFKRYTANGNQCKPWAINWPYRYYPGSSDVPSYKDKLQIRELGWSPEESHDFCRILDGGKAPWCYMWNVYWRNSGKLGVEDGEVWGNPRWGYCFQYAISPERCDLNGPPIAAKCKEDGSSYCVDYVNDCWLCDRSKDRPNIERTEDYSGLKTKTQGGLDCQWWHGKLHDETYQLTIGWKNYCRNADKSKGGPWCYVRSKDKDRVPSANHKGTDKAWDYCFKECPADVKAAHNKG